jgi:hypothetical protein
VPGIDVRPRRKLAHVVAEIDAAGLVVIDDPDLTADHLRRRPRLARCNALRCWARAPPKPKWMRWRTYNRYVQRYDRYEDILKEGIIPLIAKFLGRSG